MNKKQRRHLLPLFFLLCISSLFPFSFGMKRILTRAPSNVAAAAGSRPLFGAAPAAAARLPSASTAGPRQLYILGSHEAARQNRNSNHAALHRLAAVVSRSSRACTSNAGPAILRAPSRPPSVIRGGEASNRSHAVRELVTQNAVALGLKPSSSLRQGEKCSLAPTQPHHTDS